jgi:hypothetical protein
MTSILFVITVITQILIKFTFVKYDLIHKEEKILSPDIQNQSKFFKDVSIQDRKYDASY